jgi:hypothetical protein
MYHRSEQCLKNNNIIKEAFHKLARVNIDTLFDSRGKITSISCRDVAGQGVGASPLEKKCLKGGGGGIGLKNYS